MKEIIDLVAKRYPTLAKTLEANDQAVDELCQLVARVMLVGKTEDGTAFDKLIAEKLQLRNEILVRKYPAYAAVYKQTLEELSAKVLRRVADGCCQGGCCDDG